MNQDPTLRALRELLVQFLSHELSLPLSAIRISAELIARESDQPGLVRKLAIRIAENSERIDRLARDLLDIHRMGAGEPLPLRIERCNLDTLAKGTLERLATFHGDRFAL